MPRRLLKAAPVAGLVAALMSTVGAPYAAPTEPDFTLFESGQVRPLALSPDGTHLFAVNTPDNRLEVFRVTGRGLNHAGSVAVGLEPVAVAARSNDEVWVVNHLSRIGLDRDRDGHRDGDELDAGSDPADPASTP